MFFDDDDWNDQDWREMNLWTYIWYILLNDQVCGWPIKYSIKSYLSDDLSQKSTILLAISTPGILRIPWTAENRAKTSTLPYTLAIRRISDDVPLYKIIISQTHLWVLKQTIFQKCLCARCEMYWTPHQKKQNKKKRKLSTDLLCNLNSLATNQTHQTV